jgi:hypothetical protein
MCLDTLDNISEPVKTQHLNEVGPPAAASALARPVSNIDGEGKLLCFYATEEEAGIE